ncbi:hypothetical protein CTEN210_08536 [Chaetoceros tenuissimus]|uniref:Uncharacterized protein n=1 Tax=Chaetoceros tenuissimus TaxID=426638 RepID=A0AAD3CW26_9STRA|nr:hypothetical protein CTEN210_08536 [Chaetoceros tenuissimus]
MEGDFEVNKKEKSDATQKSLIFAPVANLNEGSVVEKGENNGSSSRLHHAHSIAISEIDSQCDMDVSESSTQKSTEERESLNDTADSTTIEELLLTIESAKRKVEQKREKLGIDPKNGMIGDIPSHASNTSPSTLHSQSQQNSGQFTETPIMMVPSQHLLLPQQVQQMQQLQQIQMGYIAPGNGTMYSNSAAQNHSSETFMQSPYQSNNQKSTAPKRRKMKLRLREEIHEENGKDNVKTSLLKRLARRTISIGSSDEFEIYDKHEVVDEQHQNVSGLDHGEISISWFDGTSAIEISDYVRKSVESKLRIGRKKLLLNLQVIDDSTEPWEEIVLSPYIPDGANFLLTFRVKDLTKKWDHHVQHKRAPPSPSAAPSPSTELEHELKKQISDVLKSEMSQSTPSKSLGIPDISKSSSTNKAEINLSPRSHQNLVTPHTESNEILVERLEKLNDTLLLLNEDKEDPTILKTEKKQVIFTISNYFLLFLSLIALFAEIHERAPRWIERITMNITTVQNCSNDKDALFQCISEGDFSGLVASIFLWISQSRLLLFGFDSPKKLWRVIYECLVGSFCWGFSYIFIRRGLNPDTKGNVLKKYWKDAVYGSLAGFNAAFMKAMMKNMLPQADEILDEVKQVRVLSFLSKLMKRTPSSNSLAQEF